MLRAVRAGLWEWDVRTGRLLWSSEIDEFLGREEGAELLSVAQFIAQAVHPDDRSLVESAYTNLASGRESGGCMDIEYRIIRPDGATVWVSCVAYLQQDDESGRPVRVLGIKRDISARKRAEEAQEKSARFKLKIAAVAPYYIYVFDLDEERRIYGNRSLRELLGYENAAEDDAAVADELRHPEDRERIIAYERSLRDLDDDAVAELESRLRRADGTWSWYLMRNAVFARNADGRVRQVVGTMTDITDLKRKESEIRRLNAELEQRVDARTAELSMANQELETFAYSASHDLRAPLRAISGFGSMLLAHCGEQLDAEGKHYLGRIHDAAHSMGEIIDALLELSRATRGQLSLERVDMSELGKRVTTELARSEPDRKVDVVIAEDVIATGDPALLRIALENLLGNAWKFTSRHEQPRIEFGAQDTAHGLRFFVRDNGVGFDMEHAARLFTPFQRLHTAAEFSGTGVGLATVQRIIERHGGRIWAESAPGAGATFYFTLGSDR